MDDNKVQEMLNQLRRELQKAIKGQRDYVAKSDLEKAYIQSEIIKQAEKIKRIISNIDILENLCEGDYDAAYSYAEADMYCDILREKE